jgi:hypothetical protein
MHFTKLPRKAAMPIIYPEKIPSWIEFSAIRYDSHLLQHGTGFALLKID